MTYDEMMITIMTLAKSQGFYGRLYQEIIHSVNTGVTDITIFESIARQFDNAVDLVIFFEG